MDRVDQTKVPRGAAAKTKQTLTSRTDTSHIVTSVSRRAFSNLGSPKSDAIWNVFLQTIATEAN